jgi:hypothetical protein
MKDSVVDIQLGYDVSYLYDLIRERWVNMEIQ